MGNSDVDFLRSAVLLSHGNRQLFSGGMADMSEPDALLPNIKDITGEDGGEGSYHAFNVAYEDLKHRYNDLQDRYRLCVRQLRGSKAGLEDENLFVRMSPSPQGQPSSGGPGDKGTEAHLQILHLQQTVSLKEREIEDLRHQLESKNESDKRVLELQKENDQLMKLNHDLTYNNSDPITKQLQDVSRQLEMAKEEQGVLQKDYNALLQENDNLLKRNLYLEQHPREKSASPEKISLSNGVSSPVEESDGIHVEMDAEDISEMVVMSLSSKEEMARIKETIWKQNEIIRILLRQQNEKGIFQKTPAYVMNGDISLPIGLGARPKIRTNVPLGVAEMSRHMEIEDELESDLPKVRRSQSMQYKKKPKNLELRARSTDQSHSRPKSNIEYTRYHVGLDQEKGHVKYTTHIKLQEDITEFDLPGERSPGKRLPEERIPGKKLPGDRVPGDLLPRDRLLGDELPDRLPGDPDDRLPDRLPGDQLPDRLLGDRLPDRLPGDRLPDRLPGDRLLGDRLPGDRREKNVFRSEKNHSRDSRPIIDPRKGSKIDSDLGVSVYDRDDLPVKEILAGHSRIRDDMFLENTLDDDDLRQLGSDSLTNLVGKRLANMAATMQDDLSEPDEFLTLTPAETLQFEPRQPESRTPELRTPESPHQPESRQPESRLPDLRQPESPSWENRNNRRTHIPVNAQTRGNGNNPRPLNIDRNECDPTARSYDNDQGLNVNLNTSQDKFNKSQSPQGFSILNNDPLVGNKTIPSKNIYHETDPGRPPASPRVVRSSRTAQEHVDTSIIWTCPICSEHFESTVSHAEFETHVDECIARNHEEEDDSIVLQEREERMCPMCNQVFSDEVPQSEFETHVNDHFDLHFEIVPSSEA